MIQNGPCGEDGGALKFAKNILEMGVFEPDQIECLIDLPKAQLVKAFLEYKKKVIKVS